MNKTPSSRRVAREAALRVLYTVDIGKQPVETVMNDTFTATELDEAAAAFAHSLVASVLRSQDEIDARLDKIAVGFPVERQTAVDRNILRLAGAEILFGVSGAPAGAVVNEAVELAKKYSTNESGRFVNGVLGTLVRQVEGTESTEDTATDTAESADETKDLAVPAENNTEDTFHA